MATKTIQLHPSTSAASVQFTTDPMGPSAFQARLQAILDEVLPEDDDSVQIVVRDMTIYHQKTLSPLDISQDARAAAEAKLAAVRNYLAPHPGDVVPAWFAEILDEGRATPNVGGGPGEEDS